MYGNCIALSPSKFKKLTCTRKKNFIYTKYCNQKSNERKGEESFTSFFQSSKCHENNYCTLSVIDRMVNFQTI